MRLVRGVREAQERLLRRNQLQAPELPAPVREQIRRVFGAELDAAAVVDRILRDVRQEGDAAVLRYNEELEGAPQSTPLEVARSEIEKARAEVKPALIQALTQAAGRIRGFHQRQLEHSLRSFEEDGVGQIVRPLGRVGIYAPGTQAVYPSTVLMMAVPARVAGVDEIVMATPAARDGSVSALKLVAADIAGVDRVFRAGGVQGIAAMAYGTATVPRVDKVCGPGNIFVTLAKKRLYGEVGIDGIISEDHRRHFLWNDGKFACLRGDRVVKPNAISDPIQFKGF